MVSNPFPLVSVVSLTHNRKEQLGSLLRALYRQEYGPLEVIVIDNASTDGTEAFINTNFPEVRVIQTQQNLGNYAYNFGVSEARGEYLCMIDDDGLPAQRDWIRQIVGRFEANPRLGVVACTIRMQDTGRIAADSPQFAPDGDAASGYPCAAYNGTGVGLRMSAVKPLMPIYPKYYFRTYIELYLSTRMRQAAWDVRLFPFIEVWHCRKTGTSDPPIAYFGLRNYYWYVWALYPWPLVLTETLHELGSRIKLTAQGKIPRSRLFSAWRDAVGNFGDAAKARQPVPRHIVEQLRDIRRHGNWQGIAPEIVPFGKEDSHYLSGPG